MTLIEWVLTPIQGNCEEQKLLPRFVSGNRSAVKQWFAQRHAGRHCTAQNDCLTGGSQAVRTAAEPELLTLKVISPPNTTARCVLLLSLFSRKEDDGGKRRRGYTWFIWSYSITEAKSLKPKSHSFWPGVGKAVMNSCTPHKHLFFLQYCSLDTLLKR